MRRDAAHAAFGILIALGLFMAVFGYISPITTGYALAEVVVERLGLPHDLETNKAVAHVYSGADDRRGKVESAFGLLTAVIAAWGLWGLRGSAVSRAP